MQPQPELLLVDDDPEIVESVGIHLRADGYRVLSAMSGEAALAVLDRHLPALAIVDLMMPGMDGFELSRRIKRRVDIPLLFLTALNAEQTKVRAIELYADDYVTKPFSASELSARVARILKRAWPAGPPSPRDRVDACLTLDFSQQTAYVNDEARRLTRTEMRLLHFLYSNAGRTLSNELILDRVWPDAEGEMNYLWEYIRRLREKLGDDSAAPRYLISERGVGYRFCRFAKPS